MAKVKCILCKETGYTASPNYSRCACGGGFIVIKEAAKGGRFIWIRKQLNILIYSVLLKQLCG